MAAHHNGIQHRAIGPGDRLVGLSLSSCIADILAGRVDPAQIEKIVAGTRAPDDATFEQVLSNCVQHEWRADPERGISLAREFRAAGKIDQPRLRDAGVRCWWDEGGRWQLVGSTEQFDIAQPA